MGVGAVVQEPGNRGDAPVAERQHDQACGGSDAGGGVDEVAAERGLSIGAGWDEMVALRGEPPSGERQELSDRFRPLILKWGRWHGDPCVVGEQRDHRVDVACFEGVGEVLHQVAFLG